MAALSLAVATIRLLFILCLSLSNLVALWKVIRTPTKGKYCNINRLGLLCTLLVNLFYISLVWTPFSIKAFSHYISLQNQSPPLHYEMTTLNMNIMESNDIAIGTFPAGSKATGWPKVESSDAGHKGTWSLVFPASKRSAQARNTIGIQVKPKLLYFDVDCTFQDVVTSAAIYSLAFITVIKLILTKKPIVLPRSCLATSAYIFLLTAVPILTTFAIRYGEQIGTNFARHQPTQLTLGYTMYNMICDIHLDDNYIFIAFVEWAGLIMMLLLTVALILAMAVKDEDGDLGIEPAIFPYRQWLGEYPVYLATLWAWPLKPTLILVFYVMYGRHWINTISWMSHLVVSISTVFLLLTTFYSTLSDSDTLPVEDQDPKKAKKVLQEQRKTKEGHSWPQVVVMPRDLTFPGGEKSSSPIEPCTDTCQQNPQIHNKYPGKSSFVKFTDDDEPDSSPPSLSSPSPPPPSSSTSPPPSLSSSSSRTANEIRSNIAPSPESPDTAAIPASKFSLPRFLPRGGRGGEDRTLILEDQDPQGTDPSRTSDV